ncbi:hypothetical protein [Pelagicoccus sp. SDUM812003]|uniref:hypothetical protein n=1 Tax=Pelagicoccus sp. SDUM812003 TaxID=3041267 RepID=UPI00280D7AF2|nr:hypothetical protein [Pelagicoccus sp. SDUM812003]MDQ8201445.1 hypothetical protein [Pelagicoccus sp. SDUM812003]
MIEQIQSNLVSAQVASQVGHIAPVRFDLGNGSFAEPYSLAGWGPEDCPEQAPAVQWLRGEFFCFPFGMNESFEHIHGPAANGPWSVQERDSGRLALAIDLPEGKGSIIKRVSLRDGERALYLEHEVRGVEGRYNYAHHPVIFFPEGEAAEVRVNPFRYASTFPERFGDPERGDINLLSEGARFDDLGRVPLRNGESLSIAQYPTDERLEDMVMFAARDDIELGWTAVSFDGYVWLSLVSRRDFPSTLFWLSNGGCQGTPWNGVNGRRLGVEDACSYFSKGLEESRRDLLGDLGVATTAAFSPGTPTFLRAIQLVHPTQGRKAVETVTPVEESNFVRLCFEDGSSDFVPVDWRWALKKGSKQ